MYIVRMRQWKVFVINASNIALGKGNVIAIPPLAKNSIVGMPGDLTAVSPEPKNIETFFELNI